MHFRQTKLVNHINHIIYSANRVPMYKIFYSIYLHHFFETVNYYKMNKIMNINELKYLKKKNHFNLDDSKLVSKWSKNES